MKALAVDDCVALAMSVQPVHPSPEHRERHPTLTDHAIGPWGEPVGVVIDFDDPADRVVAPAAVTQMNSDPAATTAVRTEGDALTQQGTWRLDSVIEKDELVQKARTDGEKFHLGEASKRRYKGRVCFHGDIAEDEGGTHVISKNPEAPAIKATRTYFRGLSAI